MRHKRLLCTLFFLASMLTLTLGVPRAGLSASTPPEAGATLPPFRIPAPANEADRQALGVKGADFQLSDIDSQVLLVEIIGVYCPQCYRQAPLFNKLSERLDKKGLGGKVKMLAIAAGGTAIEVEHLRSSGSYEFPVVGDESYAVHKLLGEPRTPFTLLVDREGKVLFAHLGIIEDIDAFYQKIQDMVK